MSQNTIQYFATFAKQVFTFAELTFLLLSLKSNNLFSKWKKPVAQK